MQSRGDYDLAIVTKTHVILDGLHDPLLAKQLSRKWADHGFDNAVDIAGQCAWIAKKASTDEEANDDPSAESDALTETQVDEAAHIARMFGIEIRERVGNTFIAANNLDALHGRMAYEYKSRFATALVFGLPALALHYFGEYLAGEPTAPRDMFFPWFIQMLLATWACIAAGWPLLWQGALSTIYLRATSDLLSSLIMLAAVVPSIIGTAALISRFEPFFGLTGPCFHAAVYLLFIALLQRWLLYRRIDSLRGKGMLMLPRFGRVVSLWMLISVIAMILGGWRAGLAVAMLLPPLASVASVNPWNPGWASLLPTFAFAALMLMDPAIEALSLEGVRIEVAAGFGLLQTIVMASGWRRMGPRKSEMLM